MRGWRHVGSLPHQYVPREGRRPPLVRHEHQMSVRLVLIQSRGIGPLYPRVHPILVHVLRRYFERNRYRDGIAPPQLHHLPLLALHLHPHPHGVPPASYGGDEVHHLTRLAQTHQLDPSLDGHIFHDVHVTQAYGGLHVVGTVRVQGGGEGAREGKLSGSHAGYRGAGVGGGGDVKVGVVHEKGLVGKRKGRWNETVEQCRRSRR
mmetsp:Transcript_11205/g.23504  ORF Transcript_11205/g.23504 Transcript_11205/m.23504 type:complete len:205 (-) Transcript_11205:400-1014(-)